MDQCRCQFPGAVSAELFLHMAVHAFRWSAADSLLHELLWRGLLVCRCTIPFLEGGILPTDLPWCHRDIRNPEPFPRSQVFRAAIQRGPAARGSRGRLEQVLGSERCADASPRTATACRTARYAATNRASRTAVCPRLGR